MTFGFDRANWPVAHAALQSAYPDGCYDEESYLWIVCAPQDIVESDDGQALFVGSAGVDGIQFAFRQRQAGLWAHYPYDNRFEHVADDLQGLVKGYLAGEIKV